ncbi:MAG: hypothetical protein BGO36_13505 [Burkholderiales bacterium 68-10]|nr:MAG: hypothetical protein BGO36_13505 [Burkholderiales bacterium 68-10]
MSDTSNESNTTAHQTDNRRVIGQGGVSAEQSNVTIVSNVLDGGAWGFGRDVTGRVLDFGAEALNANNASTRAALQSLANVSESAMSTSIAAQQSTLAAARMALDSNADTIGAAFALSGRTFGQAYDAIAGAGNMVATAYADAKGRGAKTDTMIMLAVAAMGAVALMAVQK